MDIYLCSGKIRTIDSESDIVKYTDEIALVCASSVLEASDKFQQFYRNIKYFGITYSVIEIYFVKEIIH